MKRHNGVMGTFGGDTEEWGGAQQKYDTSKEEPEMEICLSIGFVNLGGD